MKIKSNNQNKGFTLIELMISISILTMLLFTGTYSYSLMSDRWNKELGQFSHSAKEAKHLALLQSLLEGVQPFVVVDKEKKPSFFFIGDNTSLLAISRAGFFNTPFPEIFRLTTVEKENGKVDLVYQSISTESFLLTGTEQNINFSKQIILFSDLDKVSFRYYGWSHLTEKTSIEFPKKKPQWFQRFSGIDKQLMPQQYQLTLIKSDQRLSIPVTLELKPERWLSPYYPSNL